MNCKHCKGEMTTESTKTYIYYHCPVCGYGKKTIIKEKKNESRRKHN
jgi:DNA-directed RNA polymerase subunit RPC12/RpoP